MSETEPPRGGFRDSASASDPNSSPVHRYAYSARPSGRSTPRQARNASNQPDMPGDVKDRLAPGSVEGRISGMSCSVLNFAGGDLPGSGFQAALSGWSTRWDGSSWTFPGLAGPRRVRLEATRRPLFSSPVSPGGPRDASQTSRRNRRKHRRSSGAPIHGSVEQRIACREGGEAAEVPIGRPEIRDPVRNAQGGNPGVVDHRPPDPSGKKLFLENRPVRAGFGEQFGHRRLKPSVHLIDRLRDRRRRIVHPWMACDGDELVDARPWDAPQHGSFRKGSNAGARPAMPFRIGPVRVDEEVGVRCDQLPRPS